MSGRLKVGYVRVSTSKEEQDSSVEGQRYQMEQAGCDRIIVDRASASSGVRRQGWEELRLLVARGQVDKVLVVDLSRLARDGSDQEFLEECHLVGTTVLDLSGVVYENQSISGLLTTGVMSVVNKVQSRIISVKVRDGVKRRRDAGFAARNRVPFGYATEDGLVVAGSHWGDARQLLELLIKSEINLYGTIRQLPDGFPWKPSDRGLMLWLKNPILRGGLGQGLSGTQVYAHIEWGACPVLITPDEWRLIMAMLARRPKANSYGGGQPHLFSGLIRMARDGKQEPDDECPELQTCRDQLAQLELLNDQGVSGLGPSIARLQGQVESLRPLPADAIPAAYGHFAREPETLREGSDELLRPVFLHFVLDIVYQGAPDSFDVRLR